MFIVYTSLNICILLCVCLSLSLSLYILCVSYIVHVLIRIQESDNADNGSRPLPSIPSIEGIPSIRPRGATGVDPLEKAEATPTPEPLNREAGHVLYMFV